MGSICMGCHQTVDYGWCDTCLENGMICDSKAWEAEGLVREKGEYTLNLNPEEWFCSLPMGHQGRHKAYQVHDVYDPEALCFSWPSENHLVMEVV
jgi:hypothetical protein